MVRRLLYKATLLLLGLLATVLIQPLPALAEVVREEPVAAGVLFREILQQTDGGPVRIYLLEVDLAHPYVRLGLLFGADNRSFSGTLTVREMAERAGAVAALNADYFHLKEGKHPLGLAVADGQLLTSPLKRNDYYAFALMKDGRPLIDVFSFAGEVIAPNGLSFYPLAGINKPSYQALVNGQPANSDADALHLYTPAWGEISRGSGGNACVAELVVADGKVQEIRWDKPGAPIPPNGYVLRGQGTAAAFLLDNFQVGDPVAVYYRVDPSYTEMQLAAGGYALLVADGKPVERLTQSNGGREARSAVAFSQDNRTLYLVAVEQSVDSTGLTLKEFAAFLAERLGAWRALNLDGGGSTSLAVRPLGEFKPVLVNRPARGAERRVPDAISVFSTAPRGELTGLVVRGPQEIIAGLPYRYRAAGYDTYFNPYPVDPQAVTWTVAEGAGSFDGGELTAQAGGPLVISARAGNATGTLRVKVLGSEDMARLEVTPARIRLAPGEQVRLSVRLHGKDGRTWTLPAGCVQWTAQDGIGSVADGVFCAGKETAAGRLKARFGALETTVPVEVAAAGEKFHWVGPEGGEIREGNFIFRFAAGIFDRPVALQVAPLATASGLPTGYRFCDGLILRSSGELPAGAACLVRWLPQEESCPCGRAVFFLRQKEGFWRAQPSLEDGAALLGRLSGSGELAVAVREEAPREPGDLATHWARSAVTPLIQRGIIRGFPDGSFCPDAPLTRAQFAVMLAGAFGWPDPGGGPLPFRDALPTWALPGVRAAAARGVVTGYPDGRFRPDKPLTRAELVVLIDRVLALPEGTAQPFRDAAQIPRWALPAVGRVASAGLVSGSGGFFRPLATATRAEAAALVARALRYHLERLA